MSDKGWEYSESTQTVIGTKRRRLIDEETGERIDADQIFKRALGQKAFWKVYLMDFLQVLGVLDSKQVDILIYILENTEAANNTFIGTYTKIEKAVKVSRPTVATVMTKLQDKGFLRKVQNGVWQVSEQIMMKGSEHKKQLLINYYQEDYKEVAATKEKSLESEGQTTIFDAMSQQAAAADPDENLCPECGTKMVEKTNRTTGQKFLGCPNYKQHKRIVNA